MIEFQLSSFKRGYGLEELLNESDREYWSSDANLPHKITIKFDKKEYIHSVDLLLNQSEDESYTPETVNWFFNNQKREIRLCEPNEWASFGIEQKTSQIDIVITGNYSDGKDTHVRNLRIKKSPLEIMNF